MYVQLLITLSFTKNGAVVGIIIDAQSLILDEDNPSNLTSSYNQPHSRPRMVRSELESTGNVS